MEFLEPKARTFNNIPQAKSEAKRINCEKNNKQFKSHYLTTQGSTNLFQWRIKRPSPTGNCTIRVSSDSNDFMPLTPKGLKTPQFACGRKVGYENAFVKLPKSVVSEKDTVIVQIEFETEYGTIVQCSDMIVHKMVPFKP
jgi:hypothetical protein